MELKYKSFIVIEVLISIFIVFLAIVTIVVSYKNTLNFKEKSNNYENLYITTKSIINMIDTMKISANTQYTLIKQKNLNNFKVKIFAKKIQSNYNKVLGENLQYQNGNILYTLYKIKLILTKNNFKKTYSYYITKVSQ